MAVRVGVLAIGLQASNTIEACSKDGDFFARNNEALQKTAEAGYPTTTEQPLAEERMHRGNHAVCAKGRAGAGGGCAPHHAARRLSEALEPDSSHVL